MRVDKVDYERFVHKHEGPDGIVRFHVGQYDPKKGQYTRPLSAREKRLTGCFAEYSNGNPSYLQSFKTRRQALRRARYLFGERENEYESTRILPDM